MKVFFIWMLATVLSQAADDRTSQYPRLVPQLGHSDLVQRVVVSKSGKLLLTGGNDSTARLWDTTTGRIIRTIPGLPVAIFACAFTHDERFVIVSTNDYSVRVIACDTGIELPPFPRMGDRVNELCVSPDDKMVMFGGLRGAIVWADLTTGKEIHRHDEQSVYRQVECTAFSPDGRYCAVGLGDETVLVWRAGGWTLPPLQLKADSFVECLTFGASGKFIYGGCSDGTVLAWTLPEGRQVSEIQVILNPPTEKDQSPRNDIIVITEQDPGRRLLCGNKSGWWFECDLENHQVKNAIHCGALLPAAANAWSMDISRDNRHIFTGHEDGAVRRWNVDGKSPPAEFRGFSNRISDFEVAPDLSAIVAVGSDQTVFTWTLATGAWTRKFKLDDVDSGIVVAPDASWMAVGQNGALVLRSLDDGRVLRTLKTGGGVIRVIALSPDGKYLAAGDTNDVITIWNALTWKQEVQYRGNYGPGELISLTESGQSVLKNPKFQGHQGITSIAFSMDNQYVVTGGDFSARLWRTDSKKETRRFLGHSRPVEAVGISPDGSIIATGTAEKELVLWKADDASVIRRLKGHVSDVTSVDFSPDGSRLVTSSHDGTARLWNTATGDLIKVMGPFGGFQGKVRFARQGSFIVSSSWDSGIAIWNGINGENIGTLNIVGDTSWISSTPEGRFDSSSLDSIDGIQWVMPDDPLRPMSPEIFMRDYYEPRLLPRLLSDEKFSELSPLQDLNRAQPAVSIKSIRPGSKPGLVDMDVQVTSGTYPVQREGKTEYMKTGAYDLRLFRDGRLVAQYPPIKDDAPVLEEGNSEAQLIAWRSTTRVIEKDEVSKMIPFKDIHLPSLRKSAAGSPTTVEWTAYAFNEDRVKSATAHQTFARNPGAAAPPDKPKAYLIGIGVSSYESPAWNLQFADDDARQMITSLAPRLQAAGYDVVSEVLVSDGLQPQDWQATKPKIRNAMDKVAGVATPDDVVIVSFSSHGYTEAGNEFYLVPSDIGKHRPRDQVPDAELLSRCISGEELSRWIRRIDAGEMVLIIDACHSASVVEQPWFKPGPMGSRGLGQLAYDKRMRLLAASQADDFAIENATLRQGLLTYALTQDGLEAGKADFRPQDGRITLGEWLAHAVVQVPTLHELIRKNEPLGNSEVGMPAAKALVLTKSAGAGGERPFVAVNAGDLEKSSLPKAQSFQTPQFFDYARDENLELSKSRPAREYSR